jgi:hypothetical protein
MRKFNQSRTLDPETFHKRLHLSMMKEDGNVTVLVNKLVPLEDYTKYTRDQQETFATINKQLVEIGEPEMSEDEKDLMFQLGKYDPNVLISEPEDLQALAGFKVKKEIIYTDNPE